MVSKRLILANQVADEVRTLVGMSEDSWRQAKRLVEQAPEHEPRRESTRIQSRRIRKAVRHSEDGYGPRPMPSDGVRVAGVGGYLDKGTMFDD